MKRSFVLAFAASLLMAGSAIAADVTFAVPAGNASAAAFHYIKTSGGLPTSKRVTKVSEVNGGRYFLWKTSLRGIAHVCGIQDLPTASSHCVGVPGRTELQVSGNFVVLN